MTERIDHAAEALRILNEVSTDENGTIALELLDETDQWVYATSVSEAQVHATLALVEQQHLANLIAIFNADAEAELGYASEVFDFDALAARIREGLGL